MARSTSWWLSLRRFSRWCSLEASTTTHNSSHARFVAAADKTSYAAADKTSYTRPYSSTDCRDACSVAASHKSAVAAADKTSYTSPHISPGS